MAVIMRQVAPASCSLAVRRLKLNGLTSSWQVHWLKRHIKLFDLASRDSGTRQNFFDMIKWILSHLLHHANRETKMDEFYRIKDKILTKYGKVIGYDVQFIEGKKCKSCGGFGY